MSARASGPRPRGHGMWVAGAVPPTGSEGCAAAGAPTGLRPRSAVDNCHGRGRGVDGLWRSVIGPFFGGRGERDEGGRGRGARADCLPCLSPRLGRVLGSPGHDTVPDGTESSPPRFASVAIAPPPPWTPTHPLPPWPLWHWLIFRRSRTALRGPTPTETRGTGLTPTETQGTGLTPTETQGTGLTPTETQGTGLTPTETQGTGLTPTETQGTGLTPTETQGTGLTPTETQGTGLTPTETQGTGLTPTETQGTGLTPTETQGMGLTPTEIRTQTCPQ